MWRDSPHLRRSLEALWRRSRSLSVFDSHIVTEVTSGKDRSNLEALLQSLWEKARRVSELVLRLKRENESLKKHVDEIQQGQEDLRAELNLKQQELQSIKQQLLQLQSNGSEVFTKEEKEAFKARIKELIVKINSRL